MLCKELHACLEILIYEALLPSAEYLLVLFFLFFFLRQIKQKLNSQKLLTQQLFQITAYCNVSNLFAF